MKNKKGWRRELLRNTNGFCLRKQTIIDIMDEVEAKAQPGTDGEILYRKAWRKIFDMI